jgi:hypothetical protein
VLAVVVTFKVLLPEPLVIVIEAGLNVAVPPEGWFELKLTLPVKPPDGATVAV